MKKSIATLVVLAALTGCEEIKDFKMSGDDALVWIGVILIVIAYVLGKIQNIICRVAENVDKHARLADRLLGELSRISDRLETMGDDEIAIKKRKDYIKTKERWTEINAVGIDEIDEAGWINYRKERDRMGEE